MFKKQAKEQDDEDKASKDKQKEAQKRSQELKQRRRKGLPDCKWNKRARQE